MYRLFTRPQKDATAGRWTDAKSKACDTLREAELLRAALLHGDGLVIVRTHLTSLHTHELLEMMESPVQAEDGTVYYTVQPW